MKSVEPKKLARLEALVWILVYGGLFGIVLGIAVREADADLSWLLSAIGAAAVVAGVVLIFVRSRFVAAPGAQSGK